MCFQSIAVFDSSSAMFDFESYYYLKGKVA